MCLAGFIRDMVGDRISDTLGVTVSEKHKGESVIASLKTQLYAMLTTDSVDLSILFMAFSISPVVFLNSSVSDSIPRFIEMTSIRISDI